MMEASGWQSILGWRPQSGDPGGRDPVPAGGGHSHNTTVIAKLTSHIDIGDKTCQIFIKKSDFQAKAILVNNAKNPRKIVQLEVVFGFILYSDSGFILYLWP